MIEVNIHPRSELGRAGRADHAPLRGGARSRAWRPRSSCSTAATPAPAAATTSCSAARRRPTRPFLRRPDLLRSLVGYWHNHPSLSYLFSGLFIGPTSQAPRVDEARNDSLYELEIAFAELRRSRGEPACPPWLVDRLFRNLLIDVTGNTHRAEFCIDKLYSPDGADRPARPARAARLRDAAARAHEPDAAAAAARAGRALLAARRTGQTLVALGHRAARPLHAAALRVRRTSTTCSTSCSAPAIALEPEWFAPHFEFRFPLLRRLSTRRASQLELRQALEPWHVLGEEGARRRHGALRRFVGRAAAGQGDRPDRRRATSSPATAGACRCSRPARSASSSPACATAPGSRRSACTRRSPCTRRSSFDLVDTWMQPLDRRLPVPRRASRRAQLRRPSRSTRYEAEGRRLARFFRIGHTPGAMSVPPEERNPDFPFTLDLRRPDRGA